MFIFIPDSRVILALFIVLVVIVLNLAFRLLLVIKKSGLGGIDLKLLPAWLQTDVVQWAGLVLLGLVSFCKFDLGKEIMGVPPETVQQIMVVFTGAAFWIAWGSVALRLVKQVVLDKAGELFDGGQTPSPP